MRLSETGESRIRGYLFVLERSLRSFLPADVAVDAVREVESHIRERVEQIEQNGDERATVERVLDELGPPLRVAQAYSTEMTLDEAVTTGRFVPMLRALWHLATTSIYGFLWLMLVLVGWTAGLSFLIMAVLKPIFPNNVGFITVPSSGPAAARLGFVTGEFHSFGVSFGLPPGAHVYGGYWIIPVCLLAGLGILVLTQRASRRVLAWLRSRKPSATLRLRVEVKET
jgi:uncharacterized membrane protein